MFYLNHIQEKICSWQRRSQQLQKTNIKVGCLEYGGMVSIVYAFQEEGVKRIQLYTDDRLSEKDMRIFCCLQNTRFIIF